MELEFRRARMADAVEIMKPGSSAGRLPTVTCQDLGNPRRREDSITFTYDLINYHS